MAQFLIVAETDLKGASQGGKYAYAGPLEEAEARAPFFHSFFRPNSFFIINSFFITN